MLAKILLFGVCLTAVDCLPAYQAAEVNVTIKTKEYSTDTVRAVDCGETSSKLIISPLYAKSILEWASEWNEDYGMDFLIYPAKEISTNSKELCQQTCDLINRAQLQTNQTLKNDIVVSLVDNYLDITRWPGKSNLCVGYVYGQYVWHDPTINNDFLIPKTVCIPLNYQAYYDLYYYHWKMGYGQEKSSFWNTQSNFNRWFNSVKNTTTEYGVNTTVKMTSGLTICKALGRDGAPDTYPYYSDEILEYIKPAAVTVAKVIQ